MRKLLGESESKLKVVGSIFPHSFNRTMIINHLSRPLLSIVVVFSLEVQDTVDIGLPGDVFAFSFSHISDKFALKLIAIGKFEGALSPHEVFLEFTSICGVVRKLIYSSALFMPVFKGTSINIAIGTDFFSLSFRHSLHNFSCIDPPILKLEVFNPPCIYHWFTIVCHFNMLHLVFVLECFEDGLWPELEERNKVNL